MTEPPAAPGRLLQLWARYKPLVALCSFVAGAASLVLIQRQEKVAQTLVILLPLSWLIAILESQWLKLVERGRWLRHSPLLVRYLMQGLHQESFFFTLPFFLATTTWTSLQPVFLVARAGFALVSMIDPLYFDHVVVRRGLLWSFHAAAGFATVLAAAPMLWQITTATSLWLAIAAAVHRSGDEREPWHPEQSITAREALAASTDGWGTVAPGHPADLVLLDADPLDGSSDRAHAEALRAFADRVLVTWVAGEAAYSRP